MMKAQRPAVVLVLSIGATIVSSLSCEAFTPEPPPPPPPDPAWVLSRPFPGIRSLNMAQCAAVVVFEAVRQQRVAADR